MRKINREYLNNGKVGEKYITKNWIYEIKEATYSCKGCLKTSSVNIVKIMFVVIMIQRITKTIYL